MKKSSIERKIQTSGRKKPLSATLSPKTHHVTKSLQQVSGKFTQEQTPQGYNLHLRNNSELNFKPLYDALSHLCSQAQTPGTRTAKQLKETSAV